MAVCSFLSKPANASKYLKQVLQMYNTYRYNKGSICRVHPFWDTQREKKQPTSTLCCWVTTMRWATWSEVEVLPHSNISIYTRILNAFWFSWELLGLHRWAQIELSLAWMGTSHTCCFRSSFWVITSWCRMFRLVSVGLLKAEGEGAEAWKFRASSRAWRGGDS